MKQFKMKKRDKVHPAHKQNYSASHTKNCVDDNIDNKWYNVVSCLQATSSCCS